MHADVLKNKRNYQKYEEKLLYQTSHKCFKTINEDKVLEKGKKKWTNSSGACTKAKYQWQQSKGINDNKTKYQWQQTVLGGNASKETMTECP